MGPLDVRALRSTLRHTVGPAARDHTRVERGKGLEDPALVVLLERELGHEARRVVDVAAARAAIGGARAVEDEVAQVHVRLLRRRDPGPLLGPGIVARPRVDLAAVVDAHRERREEELGRLLRREAHLPEQVGAVAALERLVLSTTSSSRAMRRSLGTSPPSPIVIPAGTTRDGSKMAMRPWAWNVGPYISSRPPASHCWTVGSDSMRSHVASSASLTYRAILRGSHTLSAATALKRGYRRARLKRVRTYCRSLRLLIWRRPSPVLPCALGSY